MFKIGDVILVSAIVTPKYDHVKTRFLEQEFFNEPKKAWYVGFTFKQTGEYSTGSTNNSSYFEPPDYGPPYLINRKDHKVFRIRFSERGKEFYCLPEHVK